MKKIFVVLIAGVLMPGLFSAAHAYFAPGDLVRVMYDTSTHMEVGTDLGSISALQSLPKGVVYTSQANGTSNTINISQLNDTSWGNVLTAYFSYGQNGTTAYIAGTGPLTPAAANSAGNFIGNAGAVLGLYAEWSAIYQAGSTWSLNYSGIPNCYYGAMNKNGTALGSMGAYLNSASSLLTEVNNGAQSTQTLYILNNPNTTAAGAAMSPGVSIQTYQGTTEIWSVPAQSGIPIPSSILLLGSGLAVLFGVYRGASFRPRGLNGKGGDRPASS